MQPQMGQTAVNDSWREKLMRLWMQSRLAHEGMMLDKIQKQNEMVRELAVKSANGTIGRDHKMPSGDDMGVRIGDEVHNHFWPPTHGKGTKPTEPTQPTAPTPQQPSSTNDWLKSALLAAGLLGAGAGATAIYNYATAPSEPPKFTDTNSAIISGVDISTGKPPWELQGE